MELSFGEILLILVIAFLVLGPEELVRRSRQIGRFVGRMKAEANNFRIMAEEEMLKLDDQKRKLKDIGQQAREHMEAATAKISTNSGVTGDLPTVEGAGSAKKSDEGPHDG